MGLIDTFWHRTLRRPYRLNRVVDTGQGQTVLLLHGIGRTGDVWQHVVESLSRLPCRVVALDLLGFGGSPKPDWPDYHVDDHARAVIANIERLKLQRPLMIVGHSMGCLVAVRVARLRPDLVHHLVLFEMPLYDGLPDRRRYQLRLNIYRRFYDRIIKYDLAFDDSAKWLERLGRKIVGFEVSPSTWLPFKRSLANTIMSQTAAEDIKSIEIPMDVIYGTYDMFVIRGQAQTFFGKDSENIRTYKVRTSHTISPKASSFLVERIQAALPADSQA